MRLYQKNMRLSLAILALFVSTSCATEISHNTRPRIEVKGLSKEAREFILTAPEEIQYELADQCIRVPTTIDELNDDLSTTTVQTDIWSILGRLWPF